MLICIVCGKVIANCDNGKTTRYGGCSACDLQEVGRKMTEYRRSLAPIPTDTESIRVIL